MNIIFIISTSGFWYLLTAYLLIKNKCYFLFMQNLGIIEWEIRKQIRDYVIYLRMGIVLPKKSVGTMMNEAFVLTKRPKLYPDPLKACTLSLKF